MTARPDRRAEDRQRRLVRNCRGRSQDRIETGFRREICQRLTGLAIHRRQVITTHTQCRKQPHIGEVERDHIEGDPADPALRFAGINPIRRVARQLGPRGLLG